MNKPQQLAMFSPPEMGNLAGVFERALRLPSPSSPAGLLEQLTRSLVLIESRAAGGPGEAARALGLLPADYVASIRRALVEEPPRPEVSTELQADGVISSTFSTALSLDEFKQNRGDDLP